MGLLRPSTRKVTAPATTQIAPNPQALTTIHANISAVSTRPSGAVDRSEIVSGIPSRNTNR